MIDNELVYCLRMLIHFFVYKYFKIIGVIFYKEMSDNELKEGMDSL